MLKVGSKQDITLLSPQASVRFFEQLIVDIPNNENKYAYLMALQANGQPKKLLIIVNEILTKYPKNLILNITKAEIYLFGTKIRISSNTNIDKCIKISPGNYPASIIKSKILSAQKKRLSRLRRSLRDLLITKNRDPASMDASYLKFKELEKILLGYHLSRGEYYLLLGDFDNALNQFQFALRISGNSFQTSETIMTKIKLRTRSIGSKEEVSKS